MASHHHPHPHSRRHHHHLPTTTMSCTCCHCYNTSTQQQQQPLDTLVQTIVSQIIQQHPTLIHTNLNTPINPIHQKHQSFLHEQVIHQNHQSFREEQVVLSSLVSRIEALESSLQRFSLSSESCALSGSLRELAARVIQRHFRAYLVRRSRTLRQLKELALIKSTLSSIKSLVSKDTLLDFEALAREVMDLLIKLDTIQSADPMIRDGKRAISRELIRLLDYIDEAAVRRCAGSARVFKSVRIGCDGRKSGVVKSRFGGLGGDRREEMKVLKDKVERIGKLSKAVQNDERVERYRHFSDDDDELSFGDLSHDQREKMKILKDKVERIGKLSKAVRDEERVQRYRHFSCDGGDDDCDDEEDVEPIFSSGKNSISQVPLEILVKRHGLKSRPKKSVSFSDVDRVYSSTQELVSNGEVIGMNCGDSSDDSGEILEKLSSEVEKVGSYLMKNEDNEEARMENGGSPQSSDGERTSGMNFGNNDGKKIGKGDGKSVFAAPLPVKMECRNDLMNKKEQRL